MKSLHWFSVALVLMTTTSLADPRPGHIPAPVETLNQTGTTAQEPKASSLPSPERETQEKLTPEPAKRFVPKEQIPADSAISFPSDI